MTAGRGRWVVGNTVAMLAATAVAATALWPVYRSTAFLSLVAGAALSGGPAAADSSVGA